MAVRPVRVPVARCELKAEALAKRRSYRIPPEPVSTMMRLQTALRILSRGKGKFDDRMDDATGALVGLRPEDFPERLRGRATKVLRARSAVAERHRSGMLFKFGRLTRKQRKALTEDILALYEACLIDLGRMGEDYDFVYPKDR